MRTANDDESQNMIKLAAMEMNKSNGLSYCSSYIFKRRSQLLRT
jgi:hypothetical protein